MLWDGFKLQEVIRTGCAAAGDWTPTARSLSFYFVFQDSTCYTAHATCGGQATPCERELQAATRVIHGRRFVMSAPKLSPSRSCHQCRCAEDSWLPRLAARTSTTPGQAVERKQRPLLTQGSSDTRSGAWRVESSVAGAVALHPARGQEGSPTAPPVPWQHLLEGPTLKKL